MTEQRAWTIVAEAFDTPYDERTFNQKHITNHGLCSAICDTILHSKVDFSVLQKITEHRLTRRYYFWPIRYTPIHGKFGNIYDKYRATLAGFMAAMEPNEINELINT